MNAEPANAEPPNDVSRRRFIGRSGLVAAAAAGAVAVPSLLNGDEGAAPSGTDRFPLAGGPIAGGPLPADGDLDSEVILHIDHASNGEVTAFVGQRQVVFNDRALVARVKGLKA
jgi:hypothetical protein